MIKSAKHTRALPTTENEAATHAAKLAARRGLYADQSSGSFNQSATVVHQMANQWLASCHRRSLLDDNVNDYISDINCMYIPVKKSCQHVQIIMLTKQHRGCLANCCFIRHKKILRFENVMVRQKFSADRQIVAAV